MRYEHTTQREVEAEIRHAIEKSRREHRTVTIRTQDASEREGLINETYCSDGYEDSVELPEGFDVWGDGWRLLIA
jgi:hypothetical protein